MVFENFEVSSKTQGCCSRETIESQVKNTKNAQTRILVDVLKTLEFLKNKRNTRKFSNVSYSYNTQYIYVTGRQIL